MDINISIKVQSNNFLVKFEDFRENNLTHWEKELSLEQFIQAITSHVCSTNPEVAQSVPVGFHVETKKIDYDKFDKDFTLHHNKNKFRWEPEYKNAFDFMSPRKNKYNKNERENITLICLLCGHTDMVSELYRIPEGTLKNWLYKASRKKEHYKYDWYETIINSDVKGRIKLLATFMKTKEYLPQLTKLSADVIDGILSESK
jgi:hypothetical protein